MKTRGWLGLLLLGTGALASAGCAGMGAVPGTPAGQRRANAELYILSQSCFQGEVVPCG